MHYALSTIRFVYRSHPKTVKQYLVSTERRGIVKKAVQHHCVPEEAIGHIVLLNRVQVRCLRLLGVKLGYNYLATPVAEIEMLYGLQPLQERRKYIDILFLYRLVNGFLDCPHLVSDIDFSIPRGTRSKTLFCRRFRPTYYASNHGICRLLKLGSEAAHIDFFHDSKYTLKNKLLNVNT
ncbi:Scm-like protein with four mbt domains [Homalodisca vitripennis]|nr:Scm-like protein with four mbt domains [Homalodisca vitripennis]